VGLIEHLFNVGQLEEHHHFDNQQRVVGSADVLHVEVHLIWDDPQFS